MASKKKFYRTKKCFADVLIRCSVCHEKMKFNEFEKHLEKEHGVNALYECPYCLGKFHWVKGQKTSDNTTKHLVICMREFIEKNRVHLVEKTTKTEESLPVAKKVVCKECQEFRPIPLQMNGRIRNPKSESEGFYDSHFEKPDWWKTDWELFDESKGMYNDEIGIFIRFLLPKEHPDHLNWWHIMVKHDVWHVFLEAMEKIRDEIVILPYWCLCDGLTLNHVLHRHMILACIPKSSFLKVWKYVVRYDLKTSDKRCKDSIRIKDVFHLVNCIQYVSQHKASCDGVKIRDQLDENKVEFSHHCLNRPASPHAMAFRSMLFEGGMEKLLMQANRRKNVVDWAEEAKKLERRWVVAVKETEFKYLNCVIPLRRELEPTNEKTSMYLTWTKHKRLYVKENVELASMSEEEWYAYQVLNGNTFQTIAEEMYVFGRAQQNVMNQLVEQKKQLKRKWIPEWEQRYEEMDEKYKKEKMEKDALKLENNDLKCKNSTLNQENQDLKWELDVVMHTPESQAINNCKIQNVTIETGNKFAINIKKDNQ